LIKDLQKSPHYQAAMNEIRNRHRPIVNKYDPKNPTAVEEWKHQSSRQEGFDFLYSLLTGVKHD
jgi:hypothetical protein